MNAPTREISLAEWQGFVAAFATFEGWSVYVNANPKDATPGFPSLVIVRPPQCVFVLLRTNRAEPTKAQQDWLAALAGCGVSTVVWRPADWTEVEQRLRGPRTLAGAYTPFDLATHLIDDHHQDETYVNGLGVVDELRRYHAECHATGMPDHEHETQP